MPVTRLSREFYETFGDKLTDELVNCLNSIEASYRDQIRDLFEAQTGRFEARFAQVDQRFTHLEEKFEARLKQAEERSDSRFKQFEERFERRLAETKSALVGWMFGFWVPVVLALIGLYFKA